MFRGRAKGGRFGVSQRLVLLTENTKHLFLSRWAVLTEDDTQDKGLNNAEGTRMTAGFTDQQKITRLSDNTHSSLLDEQISFPSLCVQQCWFLWYFLCAVPLH